MKKQQKKKNEVKKKNKKKQNLTLHKNAQPFSTILPKYFLSECMI